MTATGAPAGRPLTGPTALGSDPRRVWRLTWTLAVTQCKLRFYGSALGYVWQPMRPLLLFGALYLLFTELLLYGTPVLFPIEIVQQARHAFIDPSVPSAAEAAGGWGQLAITAVILAAILATGFLVFRRRAPYVVEEL